MHNGGIVPLDVDQPRIDGLKIRETAFELGNRGWYRIGEIGCSSKGRGERWRPVSTLTLIEDNDFSAVD